MIDFHSHFLPEMDDGSRNVKMSVAMLEESRRQGVTRMVATPHFYAKQNSPERFLERRAESWMKLKPYMNSNMPAIYFGAEVHYFEGMSHNDEVKWLRIKGTNLLLVEMPFQTWSSRMVDEILLLNNNDDYQVIMAHIERYIDDQPKGTVEELVDNGVIIQSNAENFLHWPGSRKAFKMLDEGLIHILGSDTHNMDKRPPQMGDAVRVIQKKAGRQAVRTLERNAARIFQEGQESFAREQQTW